mgnify:CR=1 FL=1
MASLKRTRASFEKIPLTLRDFQKKRNKVLLWHDKGGLGDVIMQRMIFRDFKKLCPEMDLIFACLPEYIEAVKDHPDLSQVVDSRKVNTDEYCIHYNTCVSISDRYEHIHAPFCPEHRADIWAKYCGVDVSDHDMCFRLEEKVVARCRDRLETLRKHKSGPIIVFAPISKMAVKTLLPHQIEWIKEAAGNATLVVLHNREAPQFKDLGIPVISDASVTEWLCYLQACDGVIAVDTAAFHAAGGLGKPLMGIYTFADGKAYGKYFDFVLVQKHRDNGDWYCGPCFKFAECPKSNKPLKPCLTDLTKEEIQAGVREMFSRWFNGKTRISLA